jgi:hypothetical protein
VFFALTRGPRTCAALATLLVLSACAGATGPRRDAGGTDSARVDPREAVCADPGAAAPPFALVQKIFVADCTTCHAGTTAMVDLNPAVAWTGLVGQSAPAPDTCGGTLVVPGDPGASYLYQKLSSATPCYGEQMPLGDFGPVPLPDCVVALVRAWIAEGAPGPGVDAGADSD